MHALNHRVNYEDASLVVRTLEGDTRKVRIAADIRAVTFRAATWSSFTSARTVVLGDVPAR